MARSGITGFMLLHGVRSDKECHYKALFMQSARTYMPCISGTPSSRVKTSFNGRVTDYIERRLQPGVYDFYLCGRREMIRDVLWLVDDRFPGSLVYTETFF
jgi:NAD(P)H-flavin reductase